VEDPPGVAAPREHLHLLCDPRARGVDEVDHRHQVLQRLLLDPDDLLDGPRPPRPGLDRWVVGHEAHLAAGDRGHARHDAVRTEAILL